MKLLKIFKRKTDEEKVLLYLNKICAIFKEELLNKKYNSNLVEIHKDVEDIIKKFIKNSPFKEEFTEEEITRRFLFNLRKNGTFKQCFEKAKNNPIQLSDDVSPLIELDSDCLKSQEYQRFLVEGRAKGTYYIHTTNKIKEAKVLLEIASRKKIEISNIKHKLKSILSDNFSSVLKKTNDNSIDYLVEIKTFKIVFSTQIDIQNKQSCFMDLAIIDGNQEIYSIDDFTDYANELISLYEKVKDVAVETDECLYEKVMKQIKNKSDYGIL